MEFPLKTLIIENEKTPLEQFKQLLIENYSHLFNPIVTEYKYKRAVERLKDESFQLTILDIRLDEGKDCYELIDEVDNLVGIEQFGHIALTTEKDSFPLTAYDVVNPIFFPKPYIKQTIEIFIEKLKERVSNSDLILSSRTKYDIRKPGGDLKRIYEEQILCVKGEGKKSKFFFITKGLNGRPVCSEQICTDSFTKVKDKLLNSEKPFVQVHRSFIYNVQYYKSIKPGILRNGGYVKSKFETLTKVPFKKSYEADLLDKLKQFKVLD